MVVYKHTGCISSICCNLSECEKCIYSNTIYSSSAVDAQSVWHILSNDIFLTRRFLQIYWGLHVLPPPKAGTPDRQMQSQASKVKNVIAYVESTLFLILYPNAVFICRLLSSEFQGHVFLRMCNSQKPTKLRLCRCVIGDSTNGYVCGLIFYYG
jgi:hypothetical protein